MNDGVRPPRWRRAAAAARPATLWAAVVPVAVGTALACADGGARPGCAGAALGGALALQLATNLFNDWADFRSGADTAARLGPPRAMQRGWVSARALLWGTAAALAGAAACGVYLIAQAGWPIAAIGLAGMICALAYTGGPFPLGYHGLGEACVWIFFGPVAVGGTYFAQCGRLGALPLCAGAALGALCAAILVVNNLRDRFTDAQARKRTLAVRLGGRFARGLYLGLLAVAHALPPLAVALGGARPAWLLTLLALPQSARLGAAVWRRDGAALNPLLGGTARLELLFGALLCVGTLW